MRKLAAVIPVLAAAMLPACKPAPEHQGCAALSVDDAWVREAPPGARVMAGYVQLRNAGTESLQITSAASAAFKSIEFHETRHSGSSMSMQRLDALILPANGELKLAPSGKHLMLFNPTGALKAGQSLTIEFACDDGQKSPQNFEVRAFSVKNDDQHHGHH